MEIFYTGDIVRPDGSDTGVYGDPCEPGHGATLESGWIDPEWSRWEVCAAREDVRADVWHPEAGPMIDWAVERILERLGGVSDVNGTSVYAADSDQNISTGAALRMAAHIHGAPPAVATAIEYRLAHACRRRAYAY